MLSLAVLALIPICFLLYRSQGSFHIFKNSDLKDSAARVQSKIQRKLAGETKNKVPHMSLSSPLGEMPSAIDPLSNPQLPGFKKRNEIESEVFKKLLSEKRMPLIIQIVGGGSWSVFSELSVSREETHDSIFTLGPFHVFRKTDSGANLNSMQLVYDENQKTIGVLTGRVVVKVKDAFDVDRIAREYDLKLDNVSTEIRTAYLSTSHLENSLGSPLAGLNSTLKKDGRVERFYFEVVKTSWARD